MFTIGQVSEMFAIPVSTLRYYNKEGLFFNLMRAGDRSFLPAASLLGQCSWIAPVKRYEHLTDFDCRYAGSFGSGG